MASMHLTDSGLEGESLESELWILTLLRSDSHNLNGNTNNSGHGDWSTSPITIRDTSVPGQLGSLIGLALSQTEPVSIPGSSSRL